MFLHLSVSHAVHRGGLPIACWDTPPGPDVGITPRDPPGTVHAGRYGHKRAVRIPLEWNLVCIEILYLLPFSSGNRDVLGRIGNVWSHGHIVTCVKSLNIYPLVGEQVDVSGGGESQRDVTVVTAGVNGSRHLVVTLTTEKHSKSQHDFLIFASKLPTQLKSWHCEQELLAGLYDWLLKRWITIRVSVFLYKLTMVPEGFSVPYNDRCKYLHF